MYDAVLAEDFDNEQEPEEQESGWKIEDDLAADWALQKIAHARREYARLSAIGQNQILEIEAKLNTAKAKCDREIERLTGYLAEYFEKVDATVSKGRTKATYKLLSGSLVKRIRKPEPVIEDEEKLLGWLLEHDMKDLVKVTVKPTWGELKKGLTIAGDKVVIKDTGEIVDGVSVSVSPDKFVVETE